MANSFSREFDVGRCDDATILETGDRISQTFDGDFAEYDCYIVKGLPATRDTFGSVSGHVGKFLIQSVVLAFNKVGGRGLRVDFIRGAKQGVTVTLSFQDDGGHWRKQSDLISRIVDCVSSLDCAGAAPAHLDDVSSSREYVLALSNAHTQMLSSLSSKHEELLDEQRRSEKERAKKLELLEQEFQRKEEELNEERERLLLQSHQAERRRLQNQAFADLVSIHKKRFLPGQSVVARWAIFFTFIAAGALAGFFAIQSFSMLENSHSQSGASEYWTLFLKGVLSSVAAIGLLIYAAAWLKNFYDRDFSLIEQKEQFNDDLRRATWIIETILEVQHEQKGEVPDAWLNRVTSGLFTKGEKRREKDAQSILAALLGVTGSASFGPDGPRVEISKSGAKKLSRELDH